ncbi:hypothetical protein G4B88_008827 [Cannabis sativa]|uniref:Uncharacterized protein n=1 Tax=Cannabis sativa TaxID=3483 RepID=A0A7J6FJQ1_CANSA|nr:hypothetical protein G4B88_008827 [Cannabis sativa]
MSQQIFASNVVKKCLSFGAAEECQLLVNEMLGYTEENESLQAMMKDPFGESSKVEKLIAIGERRLSMSSSAICSP